MKKSENIQEIINFVKRQDNEGIWLIYAETVSELKERELIRTKNIVGERGEQVAIDFYCNTPNLPKLQMAPESTHNVDALSITGERYSIKTVTYPRKTTGVFYGLAPKDSSEEDKQRFEYLIIVILDQKLQPLKILEATWNVFYKHKRWHSRMKAWNISLTKKFEKDCKVIHEREV